MEPAAFVKEQAPSKIQITRSDRTKLVLHRPVVVGDSISGVAAADTAGRPHPRSAVALSDVRAIAVRRTDGLKTGGAILGGGLLAVMFICAATSCMDWSLGGS